MKAFYTTLKAYISTNMPGILHVDLWNDQLNNLDDENPFERPAIFIELGEINWTDVNKNGKRGALPVTFHLVSDCYDTRADDPNAMDALDLLDLAADHFDNLKLANATPLVPASTTPDNNHGNLIDGKVSYTTEITRCIKGGKNYVETLPDLAVAGEYSTSD